MPINCLVKCLIKFWTVMFQNQFMVNSWTIHEHSCFKKTALSPFVFRPPSLPLLSSLFLSLSLCLFVFLSLCLFVSSSFFLSFPLSSSLFLSFPLFLSFFNVHPAHPANFLKTKELKKRHFWLKFLSQEKPLRLKKLGAKSDQSFAHFPADPTFHTPPETDPTYYAAKPCTM